MHHKGVSSKKSSLRSSAVSSTQEGEQGTSVPMCFTGSGVEASPEEMQSHTPGHVPLSTVESGSFQTIYDNTDAAHEHEQRAGSAGSWLQRKIDKAKAMPQSLPMYKTYIEHEIISKDPNVVRGRSSRPKLNRRARRLVTVLFCIVVAVAAIYGSNRLINWVEDRRHASSDDSTMREVEVMRLKQTMEAMRIEMNKLKEAAYANSVAINGITNGVFRLPGTDDAAAKKLKFGKGNSPISQGPAPQNFDTRHFANAMTVQGNEIVPEVDLNPIKHEADIR
ncbi:B-cell receptor CD22 isoform X1 [Babesia ovata]|uniref:B-cell receptor CD22 isoform X1 n=1 Tax=Babesia ovata TaxID=189622 RepID=A0A2H6K9K1_9APIC|nr:B-cell receptor CD22 isoform X1 [Babesia ovata]GBE59658.1 B-cell receptor CD22 isoform X1 [Babesia ovata]